jgi:energy-coupling factor transporter ATP-binding protein EcfA2
VALTRVDKLTFAYPGEAPALRDVSLELEQGEVVALLGPSGSGKSTLLRAFAGLVPHFHGGVFRGRVEVGGLDTRSVRPAALAGTVAIVFQDPEDQAVLGQVENEVAFGLENLGTSPAEIRGRVRGALAAVRSEHLRERRVAELSAGELQRICLASAVALEPALLLLDEPTSQLDPETADAFLELACELGKTVVVSEQRTARVLDACDRVLFMEAGRLLLDAPREPALSWLAENRPAYLPREPLSPRPTAGGGDVAVRLAGVSFAYRNGPPVLEGADLELTRGEIVALVGPNGSGKTTLAKLAAGLLQPASGSIESHGRAVYLSQDPGRYLVRERADEEVALAVGGDLARARHMLSEVGLIGLEGRHPRDLSSGERERLALAAVLVTEPDVLVLDEPTRGMDPERKDGLASLLRSRARERSTLVVTHDLAFASTVADRIVSTETARESVYV